MSQPATYPIFGVWETFFDTNELISLHWTREEAAAKALSGGAYASPDYRGVEKWHVEEHSVPPPPSHEWERRAQLAERKLAAIYHRALATEITAEAADLRGFCLGIAAHESGALDPQWVVGEP